MSLVYRRREKDNAYVELEMQGMLDIMETEVSPPPRVLCKLSGLPATVAFIASLLTHPPGLACNETEAFG